MTNQEWTPEHERGLTDAANANGVHPVQIELDAINRRGHVAKQTHKPSDVAPYESREEAIEELTDALKKIAKPVLIGTALVSSVGTIVYVAVGFAIAAVSAATAWMAANTGVVAGVAAAGIGAMWAYLSVSSGGDDRNNNNRGSGGGQTHNHFHQNNYFGSGPQNNK